MKSKFHGLSNGYQKFLCTCSRTRENNKNKVKTDLWDTLYVLQKRYQFSWKLIFLLWAGGLYPPRVPVCCCVSAAMCVAGASASGPPDRETCPPRSHTRCPHSLLGPGPPRESELATTRRYLNRNALQRRAAVSITAVVT